MLRIRSFPILILLLGLGITFIISYSSLQDMKKLKWKKFESVCQEFENKIQIQIKANTQVLYNSAAFILSSDTITRAEWQKFQDLNKSLTELPGIQGIGYSIVIPPNQLSRFEQRICDEGFPKFKVFPEGKRDYYTSVLFVEPFSGRNLLLLGFDSFSEPVRQKAMVLSRDSDMAVISDKLFLIQDTETRKSPGTVMYAPVFRSGALKQSLKERRSAIRGWVFCPFRMDNLIKGILGEWDVQNIRVKVYDDHILIPEKLLFDSDSVFHIQHKTSAKGEFNLPMNFNNKIWTLQFTDYNRDTYLFSARIVRIFLGGTLISILLFILALNYITAQAKTLRIQALNEELKKVNDNKDRFISVLAHDLKSPFNSMLGFSELLSENFDELEKHEIESYIGLIQTSAQGAYKLLDELLLWARVQTDQFPYKPEKINLIELFKSQVDDHALIAEKKHISVSYNPTKNVFVFADELMLKTILRNLLVNAIKFTQEGGTIRISTSKTENWVTITVSDNGIGMSPDEMSNLFDVSRLQSKSGTANEKGTGLGLLLCKDMVSKHGGKIWVDSTAGHGSKFSFTLPEA
ncbi:MAG: CHASE domain-containing protein [Bacteroidota bacterium]|nr:CHASE domain-containing protein [Bacteroidota bacterium]